MTDNQNPTAEVYLDFARSARDWFGNELTQCEAAIATAGTLPPASALDTLIAEYAERAAYAKQVLAAADKLIEAYDAAALTGDADSLEQFLSACTAIQAIMGAGD